MDGLRYSRRRSLPGIILFLMFAWIFGVAGCASASSGNADDQAIPAVCTIQFTPDQAGQSYAYQVNNGEVTIDIDDIVPAYTLDTWQYDSYRMQSSFRGTIEGNRIEGSTHMIHYPQKSWGLVGEPGSPCTIIFSFDTTDSVTAILSPDGTYRWSSTPSGGQITKQWMDDCAAGGVDAMTQVYPPDDQTTEYTGTWSIGESAQTSPYDPLLSLLAGYVPDPWGMYQTSDKDLLLAALKNHDTEPDGATYILRTRLLPWYDQFQKSLNEEIDCEDSFYTATSSWLELIPVITGLPDDFSDLIPVPTPVEALQRAAKIGKKSGQIMRDKLNENDYELAYQNYRDYRANSQSATEDLSSAQNAVLTLPSGKSLELDNDDVEPLFQEFEDRYLCEKRLEAQRKLKDNERAIVAAKIQEFSSDLRKIEKSFEVLREEKRNSQ